MYRRFISTFALTLATLVAATSLILLVVDPYGIYDVAPRSSQWDAKPQQRSHDRLVKAHLARRLRPDVVMLGTSRTQVGIDPASPILRDHARRPANLALSGGSVYEARRYLEHAQALGQVRMALVGLDFTAFGERRDNFEFREGRLATSSEGVPQFFSGIYDAGATLLSLDALRDAWRTLRGQAQPSFFLPDGRRSPATFIDATQKQGGVRAAFLAIEEEHARIYSSASFDAPDLAPLGDLDDLLRFAARHHIAVRLFISPSHARATLLVDAMGRRDAYVTWKRALVRLAQGAPGDVALWDFSGADPRFTAEPVPASGDATSEMRWYWEASHYKHMLGDVVLACMLNDTCAFGRRLTEATFDAAMAEINDELTTYATLHPAETLELSALAEEVRLRHGARRIFAEERPVR